MRLGDTFRKVTICFFWNLFQQITLLCHLESYVLLKACWECHFSLTEYQTVADVLNKFLINIVPNMKISTDHGNDNDFIATNDEVTNAVNNFKNHSSIIMIKSKKKNDQSFSFGLVTYDDVLKKQKLFTLQKPPSNLIFQLKF